VHEHDNELTVSTKGREFLEQLSDCQLAKKDSVEFIYLFIYLFNLVS
jgi:hypothetical protein